MTKFKCGDRVQYDRFGSGVATCFMRLKEYPDRLLLMTAGHVVLPDFARQGDAIRASDASGALEPIGRLMTWTTIDGDPTTDAALIWVCPDLVDARLRLGAELVTIQAPVEPTPGLRLQTTSHPLDTAVDVPRIGNSDMDVAGMLVVGPNWRATEPVTYRGQIVSDRRFTEGGDSGSLVVDEMMRVVGMVVGADSDPDHGFTVITPFKALLDPAVWNGLTPELVVDFVPSAFTCPLHAPLAPAAAPVGPNLGASAPQDAAAAVHESGVDDLNASVVKAITAALRLHEIGDTSPYRISFAGKGSSGGSFGFMQGDLAAHQKVVSQTFLQVLTVAGIAVLEAQRLLSLLSVHVVTSPLSPAETALVNRALDSAAGRVLVDHMDGEILEGVLDDVNACLAQARSVNRAISLKALLYIAMWINMAGPPTTLLRWLGGASVTLDENDIEAPGAFVDGAAMERYLRATHYFSANPDNFTRLRQCASKALAQQAFTPAAQPT